MEQHIQPAQVDPRSRSINDLLQQLLPIQHQEISEAEAEQRKYALRSHRLMPVLYSVFCELKESETFARAREQQLAMEEEPDNKPDAQLMRLDNMLIAEGVAEPNSHCEGATAAATAHLDGSGKFCCSHIDLPVFFPHYFSVY